MAGEHGRRDGPGEDAAAAGWRDGGGQRGGCRGFNGFAPVLTGQHSEEGHRSADSGEERAAGGPEGQERWYC